MMPMLLLLIFPPKLLLLLPPPPLLLPPWILFLFDDEDDDDDRMFLFEDFIVEFLLNGVELFDEFIDAGADDDDDESVDINFDGLIDDGCTQPVIKSSPGTNAFLFIADDDDGNNDDNDVEDVEDNVLFGKKFIEEFDTCLLLLLLLLMFPAYDDGEYLLRAVVVDDVDDSPGYSILFEKLFVDWLPLPPLPDDA